MALPEQAAWHRGQGRALAARGLYVAARDEFLGWLDLCRGSGHEAALIPPLNALAMVAYRRGEPEEALTYLHQARGLLGSNGSPASDDSLRVHLNLLMIHTELGHLQEAQTLVDLLRPYEAEIEKTHSLVYWLNLSLLFWRRQDWVQMLRAARTAYLRSKEFGDRIMVVRALTNAGIAHMELGAHRLAERDLVRALRLCEGLAVERAYVQAELGRLHYDRGDSQRALESGREALGALLTDVALLDKEEVARVSRLFGTIFLSSGERNLALKYLNRSAAYFSQLGFRGEWQRCTELIGQALAAPPRPSRLRLTEEVQRLDFLTAVLDLTDDLESVDPYLRGHSERVAGLALLLGEAIGLPETAQQTLSHAALLHDVGMAAVDAELLEREGPLSPSELQRVRLHSVIGEEMLRPYGLSAEGLAAVRHHHEHLDGSGFPDGLTGEEIPLLARIVAVVDVYDSLTSERVYRRAMCHREAAAEMARMAGRELDPIMVGRFLDLHKV